MRRSSATLLLLAAWLASGCTPTCEQTCDKLLDCSLDSERVSHDECVDQCEDQAALYEQWEDEAKADAFDAELQCLDDATCEEIAGGACYDPELFVF